jgi:C4-dicarboxylate transporter DctM subunit
MDPTSVVLILAPIIFPIAMQLGIDPVHLGVIFVVNLEIGLVTPPVGLNLFVASAVSGLPVTSVIRASVPWLVLLLGFLVLVTYIPWISLVLPGLMLS